jgi:hypothetical protein
MALPMIQRDRNFNTYGQEQDTYVVYEDTGAENLSDTARIHT